MSRRTEIQVGLTVVGAILIMILGVAWLKDWSIQHDSRVYRVQFSQAGEIAKGAPVDVNGLRKGAVKDVRLVGDHVEVDMQISRDVVVTTDSRVAIRNVGLMGERQISIDLLMTGRPYAPGEIVQGVFEPGPGEMMGQMGGTVDAVGSVSKQFKRMADSLARDDRLSNTVRNFSKTSEELREMVSENRKALGSTLQNFSAASATTKHLTSDREAQLKESLDHFSHAAANLDRMTSRLDSLRIVIQSVAERVDKGHGTLGKLVNDEQLYNELNSSVKSLQSLIEDVKRNPKKYLKISIF